MKIKLKKVIQVLDDYRVAHKSEDARGELIHLVITHLKIRLQELTKEKEI